MYVESFFLVLSVGCTVEAFIEAYNCLVYHFPEDTAHSSDANFPTVDSITEQVVHILEIIDCRSGTYVFTLFSGTLNRPSKVLQSIPK